MTAIPSRLVKRGGDRPCMAPVAEVMPISTCWNVAITKGQFQGNAAGSTKSTLVFNRFSPRVAGSSAIPRVSAFDLPFFGEKNPCVGCS